jgi:hypothetical protein
VITLKIDSSISNPPLEKISCKFSFLYVLIDRREGINTFKVGGVEVRSDMVEDNSLNYQKENSDIVVTSSLTKRAMRFTDIEREKGKISFTYELGSKGKFGFDLSGELVFTDQRTS